MAKSHKTRNKIPAALSREKRWIAVERTDSDSFAVVLQKHLDESNLPQKRSKGVSPEEFAVVLNKDPRTAENYLSGATVPSPKDFQRIEKFLSNVKPNFSETRQRLLDAFRRSKRASNTPPAAVVSNVSGAEATKGVPPDAIEHKPQPRNLPYTSLGKLFKGRNDTLNKIHARLDDLATDNPQSAIAFAIYGLGGIGKTRIAVEYALRFSSKYSALLFVNATDAERLHAGLASLANEDHLDLPEKMIAQDDPKIRAVIRWLEHHPTWLVVLENVDDDTAVNAIMKLLPRLNNGYLLIIGRATNYPANIPKIEIRKLELDSGAQFLLERTDSDRERSSDDDALAHELATELDGLPLGLEQAGAYIAFERISFARYLMLWREKRKTVIGWFDKNIMSYDHDTGLAATWATSVDRLSAGSKLLLEILAYFSPAPVPDKMLDDEALGTKLGLDVRTAASGLFSYSLVSKAIAQSDKLSSGFTIHRLVQNYTRQFIPQERIKQAIYEALWWLSGHFVGDPGDVRTWPILDPLGPHAITVSEYGYAQRIAQPTMQILSKLGLFLRRKGRFSEAKTALMQALTLAEEMSGPQKLWLAAILNNLGELLSDENRNQEAEPFFRRSIAIIEESFGPEHAGLISVLNNLSLSTLAKSGGIKEAEKLCRRALAISETKHGATHPITSLALNGLAIVLRDSGQFDEAKQHQYRALQIAESYYGSDHPNVATLLNGLGGLLCMMDQPVDAELLFRRALLIDETSYGKDHPDVAKHAAALANVLSIMNKLAEAEQLLRRTLGIEEASYGADHPILIPTLMKLASILSATGQDSESGRLGDRAAAIAKHGS